MGGDPVVGAPFEQRRGGAPPGPASRKARRPKCSPGSASARRRSSSILRVLLSWPVALPSQQLVALAIASAGPGHGHPLVRAQMAGRRARRRGSWGCADRGAEPASIGTRRGACGGLRRPHAAPVRIPAIISPVLRVFREEPAVGRPSARLTGTRVMHAHSTDRRGGAPARDQSLHGVTPTGEPRACDRTAVVQAPAIRLSADSCRRGTARPPPASPSRSRVQSRISSGSISAYCG